MNAREMWEALGWIYQLLDGDPSYEYISGGRDGKSLDYRKLISFEMERKVYYSFKIAKEYKDLAQPCLHTPEEHKAIHQQMIELGWI